MTGDEATKVSAAVTAKDSAVTVTVVRKDADGSYDVVGTKDGTRVFYEVSADLSDGDRTQLTLLVLVARCLQARATSTSGPRRRALARLWPRSPSTRPGVVPWPSSTMSQLFVRTLREDPADAEVPSHRWLVRAGYIRRAAPGIYSWLPLGLKVLAKVEEIVREEMVAIGAQEVRFPALLPREPYEATNRWTEYGPNLFRLKDRKGADYLLGPTHEEMFTLLVKDLYGSYKDLPLTLFQIQTKYRDEARPRAGLLRGREFIMKDSYTFDMDAAGLQAAYERHREAYIKVMDRLGLEYVIVKAQSGAMGGSASEEFLAIAPNGEDTFVRSPGRLRGQRRGRHRDAAGCRRRLRRRPRRPSSTPRAPARSTPS